MATFLGVNYRPDGYAEVRYDVGVDRIATLMVRAEDVATILELPADVVVGDVMAINRPPERRPGK